MNADRISRSLTPSEAKRERFVSVEDPEIVLTYANGDVVSLKADPKKEDRALVQLQYEGKKIIVSIEGYRVMRTVAAAISPEGFSGENVVVEGA